MKTILRLVAVGAAAGGLLVTSLTAAAAPVVRQNFDVTVNEVGPDCEGLPVLVTETLHFVVLINADNSGGFHVESTVNIENGTGINLVTGVTYVAGGANATSFNVKPPFPAITTNEATALLVSKGPSSSRIQNSHSLYGRCQWNCDRQRISPRRLLPRLTAGR